MILGWRFFFYANERNEPIHIHYRKGDAEAKYWLEVAGFQVVEAHAYNLSPTDKTPRNPPSVRRAMFIDSTVESVRPPPGGPCIYSSVKNSNRYLGS